MKYHLVFLLSVCFVSGILSRQPQKKGEAREWEGISLRFPEDVILHPSTVPRQKILKIYPARGEDFFIVIRKFSATDPKYFSLWKESGLWSGSEPVFQEKQMWGRSVLSYRALQVRHFNELVTEVVFWKNEVGSTWVWITTRREREDLTQFWSSSEFLEESPAKK